jgi:hypothetical protein
VQRGILYVASDVKHLPSIAEGERTWWCVAKASEPGDIGILYQIRIGIGFLFKFLEFEEDNDFCKSFGMATGNVEMLRVLSPPVGSSKLRSHAKLRNLKAVRRNFQNRWFEVEEDQLGCLVEFLMGRGTP